MVLCMSSSSAAVLEYRAEFGSTTTRSEGGLTYITFELAGPKPTLTGTLNAGDQFRFVYSAAPGFLFSIEPNLFAGSQFGFYADLWTEGFLSFPQEIPGTSVEFFRLSGTVQNASYFAFESDASNRLHAAYVYSGGDFSFKSIGATFTIPQGFSRTFTNFSPNDVRLEAFSSQRNQPIASLIPDPDYNVPEPASIFLVASAMGVFALARHKRSRS